MPIPPDGLNDEERIDFIAKNPSLILEFNPNELREFAEKFTSYGEGALNRWTKQQIIQVLQAIDIANNKPLKINITEAYEAFLSSEIGYIRDALDRAISSGDERRIRLCMRSLRQAGVESLPIELLEKIHNHRDEKILKSGPKPRELDERQHIVNFYRQLCEKKEFAKAWFYSGEKAFEVDFGAKHAVDVIPWKRPEMTRQRNIKRTPNRGDIKGYVCDLHKISERTLDTLLGADSKRKALNYFNYLCESMKVSPDDAKRKVCKNLKVKASNLDKWLADDKI